MSDLFYQTKYITKQIYSVDGKYIYLGETPDIAKYYAKFTFTKNRFINR